jgi:hypothetical protein
LSALAAVCPKSYDPQMSNPACDLRCLTGRWMIKVLLEGNTG